jgi:hypothetical protein
VNGGVAKQFRRTNIKGFINHFGLNKTRSARIVGYTPDYIGFRPSKPIKAHNYILEFYKSRKDVIENKCSKNFNYNIHQTLLSPRLVLSGSYDSAGDHLRTIFADNPSNIDTKEILRILNLNKMSWFNTPILNLNNVDDLSITTHINANSNPGHYFKLLLNPTKGSVLHYSLPIAKSILEEASLVPTKNLYLWDVLGREKDVKLLNDDGTEVSTRVVLNTEAPSSLLLCNFAQKISIALQRKGIENKFNTTDEFNQKKYFKYYQNNFKYDYCLDADWKNF